MSHENFSQHALELLAEQKKAWPALKKGYDSLASVLTKSFQFDGFSFTAQYNPYRITSTAAKTDPESIKKRKCFLCSENRPEEQQGIGLNNFILLCNPFPVFTEHFTIALKAHSPQKIEPYFSELLSFAEKFRNTFAVFYNGPECGASAPDHMHFQAGTIKEFPLINQLEVVLSKYGSILRPKQNYVSGIESFQVNDGLRKFIYLRGNSIKDLEMSFIEIFNSLPAGSNDTEPKLNIIACYRDMFEVIIFLRKKHRPDQFFLEGEKKLTFSPAAIDTAGLCILPLEKDYEKFNKELLTDCMKQVFV